ncbi:MAG: alpha/beta fold hydrolase [Phycisphaerales bacterium JB043]
MLDGTGLDVSSLEPELLNELVRYQVLVDSDHASFEEKVRAQEGLMIALFERLGQPVDKDQIRRYAEQTIRSLMPDDGAPTMEELLESPAREPLDTPLAHIETTGTGERHLILIPNFAQDWTAWSTFMEHNTDRFTMTAVTLPGFGGSTAPPLADDRDYREFYWLDNSIRQLRALIEKSDAQAPILVGHGGGSYAAVRLASEHPDLVGGVVVINGRIFSNKSVQADTQDVRLRTATRFRNWMLSLNSTEFDDFVTRTIGVSCGDPTREQALETVAFQTHRTVNIRYFTEIMSSRLEPFLETMTCPLLVATSVGDNAEHWSQGIGDTHDRIVTEFEGAGYLIMETKPDELGRTIETFFESR